MGLSTNNPYKTKMIIDKTILVPLTNSLYIPGKISDPEHVIIDVGTGYYVKKVGWILNWHFRSKFIATI